MGSGTLDPLRGVSSPLAAAFSRAAGYCTEKSEGHRRPWGAARRRRPGILLLNSAYTKTKARTHSRVTAKVPFLKTIGEERSDFTQIRQQPKPAGAGSAGPCRIREAGQHVEAAGHTCTESARSTLVVLGTIFFPAADFNADLAQKYQQALPSVRLCTKQKSF